MDMHLKGACAVVTGGLSNLGRAICTSLAREGVSIVLTYTGERKKESAFSFASFLRDTYHCKAQGVQLDVTDEKSVADGIDKALSILQKIDILINNAGVFTVCPQRSLPENQWDQVMDVNIKGVWRMVRHTQSLLEKTHGVIVNISSINAARPGFDHTSHYDASKGAVSAYTRSLAKELSEFGIRVNAVAPGLLDSQSLRDSAPSLVSSYITRSALNSLVEAEEVASLVTFLASDRSKGMTGEILTVDCGYGMM
ncbi:MAG: SDR family NAD(P)-dependent oxidoreductase [Sphaerochaetaceae bacterium]|nr:SDR family NAD(P)-dependent oxidoreductase [Sphaerochaetaceae bacterium]MDC7247773.1 SDR family NAD(P)-dependent oxidoreductase [Sphaerochaetaceae bacterium]